MLERLLKWYFRNAKHRVKAKYDRVLPFGDYISDRWEKAHDLNMGKGSSIYDSSFVFGAPIIGKNVWIGPYTVIDATGGLEIGDHCNISAGVQIYSHDSVERCLSGGKNPLTYAPVVIGERTYIGPNSIITKGVTIGSGCVIGANSLVLEDIADGSLAVGSPCKPVRPVKSTVMR